MWIKLLYELDFTKGDKVTCLQEMEERNKRLKSEKHKQFKNTSAKESTKKLVEKNNKRILRTLVEVG